MDTSINNIARHFARAGLELELLRQPIRGGGGTDSVVQLDVARTLGNTRRREWFRLFQGHPDNRVLVLGRDRKLRQLVLLVAEPERSFELELPRIRWPRMETRAAAASRVSPAVIVGSTQHGWITRTLTSADKRHYLMGVDERQLFIAQLTQGCSTVAAAHALLGRTVQFAEGKRRGSSLDRQGEWFFLETSHAQRDHIEAMISGNRVVVRRKVGIGGFAGRAAGNPHVVSELVVLTGKTLPPSSVLAHQFPVRSRQVYVRGAVRHVDHRTIKFAQWREVLANNEGATAEGNSTGTYWID